MKKQGILNTHVSQVLSTLGHTDSIVIADCGLPIFDENQRIDLSLKIGVPSFLEVLDAIIEDMAIEKVTLAKEVQTINPLIHEEIIKRFHDKEIEYVSHEQFKEKTVESKAVIRTGEATPYANIILHSGVIF